jgi:hypothetical protein
MLPVEVRWWLERLTRATGTFGAIKRTTQGVETLGLRAAAVSRRLARGDPGLSRRRGNIVMFHFGRSGSSVIAGLLARHPQVRWDGQLFNYHLQPWRRNPQPRLEQAYRLIDRRMSYHDVPFYGFEVLPSQLKAGLIDEHSFAGSLDRLGFAHFIFLTRRNLLKRIVSHLVARERGRWHMRADADVPLTRVHVDIESLRLAEPKPLLVHLADLQADADRLRGLLDARHCLQLVYEDDVLPDPRIALQKACAFLDIEAIDLPVRHGRTTPQALADVVDNFPELHRALEGTPFEWMLDEGPGQP